MMRWSQFIGVQNHQYKINHKIRAVADAHTKVTKKANELDRPAAYNKAHRDWHYWHASTAVAQ